MPDIGVCFLDQTGPLSSMTSQGRMLMIKLMTVLIHICIIRRKGELFLFTLESSCIHVGLSKTFRRLSISMSMNPKWKLRKLNHHACQFPLVTYQAFR